MTLPLVDVRICRSRRCARSSRRFSENFRSWGWDQPDHPIRPQRRLKRGRFALKAFIGRENSRSRLSFLVSRLLLSIPSRRRDASSFSCYHVTSSKRRREADWRLVVQRTSDNASFVSGWTFLELKSHGPRVQRLSLSPVPLFLSRLPAG